MIKILDKNTPNLNMHRSAQSVNTIITWNEERCVRCNAQSVNNIITWNEERFVS